MRETEHLQSLPSECTSLPLPRHAPQPVPTIDWKGAVSSRCQSSRGRMFPRHHDRDSQIPPGIPGLGSMLIINVNPKAHPAPYRHRGYYRTVWNGSTLSSVTTDRNALEISTSFANTKLDPGVRFPLSSLGPNFMFGHAKHGKPIPYHAESRFPYYPVECDHPPSLLPSASQFSLEDSGSLCGSVVFVRV